MTTPSDNEDAPPGSYPEKGLHKKRRLLTQGKVGVVVVAAALAAGVKEYIKIDSGHNQATAALQSLSDLEGVSINTLEGKGLKGPGSLPGKRGVSSVTQTALERSTVVILSRLKGTSDFWNEDCTGIKVSINDRSYVQAAAHCGNSSFTPQPGQVAVNTLALDSDQYAVAAMKKISGRPPYVYDNDLLAEVTGNSMIINGPDTMLLATVPYRGEVARYNSIPAVSLNRLEASPPTPGDKVGLYALPGSVTSSPIEGSGNYLDRAQDPTNITTAQYDFVGEGVKNAFLNPLEKGGSGSSFASGGYVSGPLHACATSIGYLNAPIYQNHVSPQVNFAAVLQFEQATSIRIGGDVGVVCDFSVDTPKDYTDLLKGFNELAVR